MVRQKTSASKKENLSEEEGFHSESRSQIGKPAIKSAANKWTDAEYSTLVQMVRQHGEDWSVIATNLPNKTAKQCMQKFKNSQRSAKKGNWAADEDEILLKWVQDYGPTKWTECSKLIKGRCGKQCRERWVNILNPHVKKGNWSDEEQNLIFDNLYVHYTSWSSISRVLPGRTENSIKNYFYSSLRRLKSNLLCNIIKKVYVDKSEEVTSGLKKVDDVCKELSKLNMLSQRICTYLLSDKPKDQGFTQFLVTVLFTEDPPTVPAPAIKLPAPSSFKPHNTRSEASIYVPQEMNKQIIPTVGNSKENDAKTVIAVLKSMVNQVNKPGLLTVINFLENQLISNTATSVTDCKDNGIKIRLPFCWNCKTKTCNLHNQ